MSISLADAAALLQSGDRFCILLHAYPDGDTIGSGYALCRALRALGKQANVRCAHAISPLYGFITDRCPPQAFSPQTYVAVDVASLPLLGQNGEDYAGKIALCIDHHGTNTGYARHTLVDPAAAATAELVLSLIDCLGVPIDAFLADCIYTGLSTDTGCFRYTNTTATSHRIAARMMEAGANVARINEAMFDVKSRSRIAIEKSILDTLEYYDDGKIAFITITRQMREQTGVADGDLEGITSLPRSVEGVLVGCTLRENDCGEFKVSVRSREPVNSAQICATLGGGGHPCAAGCRLACPLPQAKERLLSACREALASLNI